MKFLIAGYGAAGRRHMRNLQALGEKDILFYRTRRSTLPEDELKDIPVEYDIPAALAHKPDAVIIANPTAYHLDMGIPAARQGCHILLEKPISHNLERLDDFKSAVKQGGGQVLVGFQLRFHPGYLQVKRWLDEGAIGRILCGRAHYGDYMPGWHPWEDYRQTYSARASMGGGAALTLCHPLDYIRWLMGEVESVSAISGKISDLEIDVDDIGEIGMRFTSGAVGSVHVDLFQQPPSYRFEITGTQGTVMWDQTDNLAKLYRASTGKWEAAAPPPGFERNDLFLAEMRHFLDVMQGKAAPVCTLADGERILRMVMAVFESSSEGRTIKF